MGQSARVTSIDALRTWRESLSVFHDDAVEALGAVELDLRRTLDWLDGQTRFWQLELRRRDDAVVQAKSELARKKMMPIIGRTADTTEQDKNLRRAQMRKQEAEEKLERARQLGPILTRAIDEYRGPARRLSGMLDADVPNAIALMERKLDALQAYLALGGGHRAETTSPPREEADHAP